MLSSNQQLLKRFFDLVFAIIGIIVLLIPIVIFVIISTFSSNSFGVFKQLRVGQYGELFVMYKIKTMHYLSEGEMVVTQLGKFLRKTKLDELPQLFNVLIGDMSFVGPRPDIQGYADNLKDEDKIILSVKPGITGPATLKFSNEEELLSQQKNPLQYNDDIIWPKKIEINKRYVLEWNFLKDIKYIWLTFKQLFH